MNYALLYLKGKYIIWVGVVPIIPKKKYDFRKKKVQKKCRLHCYSNFIIRLQANQSFADTINRIRTHFHYSIQYLGRKTCICDMQYLSRYYTQYVQYLS